MADMDFFPLRLEAKPKNEWIHSTDWDLEAGLFKRITGLDVKEFELLCSLGIFNASLMNDAVYTFKRYEDSSLNYTGIDRHKGESVGGYDTVLTRDEFEKLFGLQQGSLKIGNYQEQGF